MPTGKYIRPRNLLSESSSARKLGVGLHKNIQNLTEQCFFLNKLTGNKLNRTGRNKTSALASCTQGTGHR